MRVITTEELTRRLADLHGQAQAHSNPEAHANGNGPRVVVSGNVAVPWEGVKALDAALTQIERSFGKGSIMRLGGSDKAVDIAAMRAAVRDAEV